MNCATINPRVDDSTTKTATNFVCALPSAKIEIETKAGAKWKKEELGVDWNCRNLPKTMANVLVALRSFFADDFSRFFFDALCTL